MNKNQEKEDFLAEERRLEAIQEHQDGEYSEFLSQNIKEFMEDFIDENKQAFIEFLKENIIDETYDMNYWKEIFCKEQYEEDFIDYCKERYIR